MVFVEGSGSLLNISALPGPSEHILTIPDPSPVLPTVDIAGRGIRVRRSSHCPSLDPIVWLQGESHLHVHCTVSSKTFVHVSWQLKYPQVIKDQENSDSRSRLYRGPLQLLGINRLICFTPDPGAQAGGCLKYWRVGDPMLLAPLSTPQLTLNISSSDHCQR